MATRKRLSDLLREEVQRPEGEADTAAENPAEKPAPRSSRSKPKGMGSSGTSRTKASATKANSSGEATPSATSSEAEPSEPTPPTTEQNGHDDITPLKAALAELQTKLEAARTQEGILQRQVEALQADLKERDTTVQKLQTDLRDVERLRTELEEAKQMIRGLTEQRQAEEAARKAAPQPLTPSTPAPAPAQSPDPSAGALRRQTQVHATAELWRVLQHPVAVEIPSTQLTNDDIGWVD